MKKRMARLISYKRKDENRYSTFSNVSFGASNDNLAFKIMSDTKKPGVAISPAVHKKSVKRSQNKKPRKRKRWITWTCCYDHKWIRRILCCPCLCCFYACCKRKEANRNSDDDIDKAVEEYKQQQGVCESKAGSQRSTLNSEEKGASRFWNWDESWKSNSDKFLESLELDCVGSDKSLKRKLRQKNSKVRMSALNNFLVGGCYIILSWIKHDAFKSFFLAENASFPSSLKTILIINDKLFLFAFFRRNSRIRKRKFAGNWKQKWSHCYHDPKCCKSSGITDVNNNRPMASTVG
jgi:hypothetical protein